MSIHSWAGLDLDRPRLMGIINVTPDSFSDGGQALAASDALAQGQRLGAEGADILDIGGESTRPGASPVSLDEELSRVLPPIRALAAQGHLISIDTRHPEVMRQAAAAGAGILNDVSGFTTHPDSLATAVELGLPVCLMHMQGTPQTMQNDPQYTDAVSDVLAWLCAQAQRLEDAGLPRRKICIDPGIGFGKTLAHNLAILNAWQRFEDSGYACLLGASRKSFIEKITGETQASARMPGSLIAAATAYRGGCRLFRVHDVAESKQALEVEAALQAQALA